MPRGVTVEGIARQIAQLEGLDFGRLRGRARDRECSRARLTVTWLGREIAAIAVARAARFFGRDTSTMINGVNKLEEEMSRDRDLSQRLHALREKVRPAR